MVDTAKSGHIGGSLSAIDIITVLYYSAMRIDPKNPRDPARDRFVLSKGHVTPALYSTLAARGFFPEDDLATYRQLDSYLSGHAEMTKVPGVDMSTGSLGQGLSAALGMALAARIDNLDYRVYAMVGDGEIQEGQIWEAAMAAAQFGADNLVLFIDNNDLQIDGTIGEVMSPYPIDAKFAAFGWQVETIDGHDLGVIGHAIRRAGVEDKPTVIIAKTVKGKGVSFMENDLQWHGGVPSPEQFAAAYAEIDRRLAELEG